MALLDRNGVYGAQRFSVAAREQKCGPIIGGGINDGRRQFVCRCWWQSRLGYANLCSLLTQAHPQGSVKDE